MTTPRRGLTLLEILVSLAILAAAAAATTSVLGDARGASARAALQRAALDALTRWADAAEEDGDGDWSWTDAAGREWRVRAHEDAERWADEAGGEDPPLRVAWRAVRIEVRPPGGGFRLALVQRRPVLDEGDRESAP